MGHGAKRRCEIWDVGFETGETGIRGQRSNVGDQRSEIRERATGIRFSDIEIILWERLSSRDFAVSNNFLIF
jgi:hypothetical protein